MFRWSIYPLSGEDLAKQRDLIVPTMPSILIINFAQVINFQKKKTPLMSPTTYFYKALTMYKKMIVFTLQINYSMFSMVIFTMYSPKDM